MEGKLEQTLPDKTAPSKWRRRRIFVSGGTLLVLFVGVTIFVQQQISADGPVPSDVSKAVNFSVYYPNQSKLPAGYTLDDASFRLADTNVIVYSVRKNGEQLVFSETQTPDTSIVDKFTSSYIPLHNTISTKLGKAAMGAAGQGTNLKTIVSLPISNGPWLIVTAPANTKQSDMRQILQSLVE
jgi:hypothetical protein